MSKLREDDDDVSMTSSSIFRQSLNRMNIFKDDSDDGSSLYGQAGSITNDTDMSNPRTMDSRLKNWQKILKNKQKYDKYNKNAMRYGYGKSVVQPSIQSIRDTVIPYRQPNQFFANNAVNLVRLGNQAAIRTENEFAV